MSLRNEREFENMSFSDDPLQPEEAGPSEEPTSEEPASYPEETILPEGFVPLVDTARVQRSRRRRAHRKFVLTGATERAAVMDSLARRAFPSFEFFVFALLCGAVLGAGYLLDLKSNSQAILLLGLLLAPLLTPWVGMTLAATTGSWRFLFLTLGGLLVASALVFLTGGLAGLAGRLWTMPPPEIRLQAEIRSHIWPLDLFIVALGAVLLVVSFVRSEQKPILPSLLLAYGLFMPASAAGFEWGNGDAVLFESAIQLFFLHLALATIVGGITLLSLRFRPVKASGYILPFMTGILSLAAIVIYTGTVTAIRDGILVTRRTAPTPTITLKLPSPTPTKPPVSTLTVTSVPSETALPTNTLEPTPAYAIIKSPSGGGANVRSEPGAGTLLATLINGTLVQVLPEIRNVDNATWVRIRLQNNIQGWVLQSVLSATDQTPIPTSTFTPTP